MTKIDNGELFDIGQTVNGVSKFIMINDKWYYFEKSMFREYEYDQDELTKIVKNVEDMEDVKYLGNVFDHL